MEYWKMEESEQQVVSDWDAKECKWKVKKDGRPLFDSIGDR
jgi:hypothetical protein